MDNGYDIPPDERMMVEVIQGFSAEGEPIYERHSLNRRPGPRFTEPLDLSDANSTSSRSRNRLSPSDSKKYQKERERLASYTGHWKPDYHVKPEDLAKDGFIYKGPGDMAMCVFCLKAIKMWDPGDVVSNEHKRLYPRCPWVLGKAHNQNIPISDSEALKKDIGINKKGGPQFTDMKSPDARVNTFHGWMKRTTTPATLARAGFFYDGDTDIVTCFHCGMKIPGFDIDGKDLNERHAQHSPTCPYARGGHSNGVVTSVETSTSGVGHSENGATGHMNGGTGHMNGSTSHMPMDVAVAASVGTGEDTLSPAMQAVLSMGDYSMEAIVKAVETLSLRGSEHIKSQDILKMLDPDFY